MKVVRSPEELGAGRRAVAIGTFDGVHLGHRRVLEEARGAGTTSTVVTFDPHPRTALGNRVELLTTLERRLELLADAGLDEALVLEFDLDFAQTTPEAFAELYLRRIGAEVVVAGAGFRFGHRRAGDLGLLESLGFDVRTVPVVEGVSSSAIRALEKAGEVERAAALLGRPVEIEGVVVSGDARGGTLGFPTANLRVEGDLLVPAHGIYAGAALGTRAATSIGVNPHYGGLEQRVETFLLDYEGDLYGQRLIVELWRRLRDERSFDTEAELVAQIARDVEETRAAERPFLRLQNRKNHSARFVSARSLCWHGRQA
jgi:riboflavin kinase / FMN adenylyltransferase